MGRRKTMAEKKIRLDEADEDDEGAYLGEDALPPRTGAPEPGQNDLVLVVDGMEARGLLDGAGARRLRRGGATARPTPPPRGAPAEAVLAKPRTMKRSPGSSASPLPST